MPPDDPPQLWLQLLEAEQARRAAQRAYDDGEGDRLRLKLWEELELIAERSLPYEDPALVDALAAAPDWGAIDRLRDPADLSPIAAVALIMTRDPETACRRMVEWARRHAA